jgi:hypothetical protein
MVNWSQGANTAMLVGVSFRHSTDCTQPRAREFKITSATGTFWTARKLHEPSSLNRIRERVRHRRSIADKRASHRNKSVARFDHNCAGRSQFHTSTAYRDGRRGLRTGSHRVRSLGRQGRPEPVPVVQRLRASRSMPGRPCLRCPQAPSFFSTSAFPFARTRHNTAYVKLR